jgi:thioredoxin 1
MKRSWWLIAVVAVAVLAVVGLKQMKDRAPAVPAAAGQPLSGADLATCLASGQPTMADFGKGWCQPCKLMVPVLEEAAAEWQGRAHIVYVDMEVYPQVAEAHGVRVMPTQIFFDRTGKEVSRHEGFIPQEEIAAQLREIGAGK